MKKVSVVILIVIIILFSFGGYVFYQEYQEKKAYERQIYREEQMQQARKKMYSYTDKGASWVVKKSYGGGRSISYDVNNWDYNDYKDEYKIDVSITWSGKNFGGYYAADGMLRIRNGKMTWEPNWHNTKLEDYLDFRNLMGVVIGGVIVLGTIDKL